MTTESPTMTNAALVTALLGDSPDAVLSALPRSRFYVPARGAGDHHLLQLGAGLARERLVWAFTDDEALGAWDRRPASVAAELDLAGLVDLLGADGPAVLALNPAGPGAHLVSVDAARGALVTPPGGEHPPPPGPVELVDPESRLPVRRGLKDAADAAATVAGDDPLRALALYEQGLAHALRIGDRLHAGAMLADVATIQVHLGRDADALANAERAGMVLGSLGEIDLATVELVRAAELARDAGDSERAERLARNVTFALSGDLAPRLVGLWRSFDPGGAP